LKINIITSIESLRFLSVFFVILFHLDNNLFPNGYLGVDIFFTISGFVITKSLSKKDSTFSIRELFKFWGRRIMRLLPSLYFVIGISFIFSILFDPPHITKQLGQTITSTVLNATNIFYYYTIDYFNNFHNHGPYLHFWSLSLEEQFYLTFPFLFFIRSKKIRHCLFIILFLLSLSSWFYFNIYDSQAAFYMPWNRFWQLYLGGIIALNQKQKYGNSRLLTLSIIALITLLSFPFFNHSLNSIVVGIITTIFLFNSNVNNSIFDNKTLVKLGSSSYVVYLWHQPVLYNTREYIDNPFLSTGFSLILICLFSIFTIIFIENKFRHQNKIFSYLSVLLISSILIASGIFANNTDGFFRFKSHLWKIDNLINEKEQLFLKKQTILNDLLTNPKYKIDSSILIVGDSKGEDLMVSLAITEKSQPNTKYLFIKVQTWDFNDSSKIEYSQILKVLSKQKTKILIFTNTWKSIHNDNCAAFINKMANNNGYKTLVLSTSNYKDVSSLSFEIQRKGLEIQQTQKLLKSADRLDWLKQSNDLKNKLNLTKIRWLDKENAFIENGRSLLISDSGKIRIYDTGHVTIDGAEILGNWLRSELSLQ
jgi:peptidoglycan/LPS O-acetylase OafA/YrhL